MAASLSCRVVILKFITLPSLMKEPFLRFRAAINNCFIDPLCVFERICVCNVSCFYVLCSCSCVFERICVLCVCVRVCVCCARACLCACECVLLLLQPSCVSEASSGAGSVSGETGTEVQTLTPDGDAPSTEGTGGRTPYRLPNTPQCS